MNHKIVSHLILSYRLMSRRPTDLAAPGPGWPPWSGSPASGAGTGWRPAAGSSSLETWHSVLKVSQCVKMCCSVLKRVGVRCIADLVTQYTLDCGQCGPTLVSSLHLVINTALQRYMRPHTRVVMPTLSWYSLELPTNLREVLTVPGEGPYKGAIQSAIRHKEKALWNFVKVRWQL